MPFTIDDPHIERLARALAAATGEPVPRAVAAALSERLDRVRQSRVTAAVRDGAGATDPTPPRLGSVAEIQAYLAALPELDPRTPDEILGYDTVGLPNANRTR